MSTQDGRGRETPPPAFTRDERQAVLDRLARMSAHQEFTKLRASAEARFWGEWLRHRTRDAVRRAMTLDASRVMFHEWFTLDYVLPGGSTLTELLLDREGNYLSTGEQRYLERLRLSHVRPYEVIRSHGNERLDLRDLWAPESIEIPLPTGTKLQTAPSDVLVTRVVLGGHGRRVLDGFGYVLPAMEAAGLLKRLEHDHRELVRERPDADLATFFKQTAMIPFHLWLDRVALRPQARRR